MHCWPQHILPRNDTHHLFSLSSSYSRDFRLCHVQSNHETNHSFGDYHVSCSGNKKKMKNSFRRQRKVLSVRACCMHQFLSFYLYLFLYLSLSIRFHDRTKRKYETSTKFVDEFSFWPTMNDK